MRELRELRFRVWDGRMIQPCIEFRGNTVSWVIAERGYGEVHENRVLMQYTGKKDIDGAEIYEGDLVDGESQYEENFPRAVFWHRKLAGWYIGDEIDCTALHAIDNIKVVGNIFEGITLDKDLPPEEDDQDDFNINDIIGRPEDNGTDSTE